MSIIFVGPVLISYLYFVFMLRLVYLIFMPCQLLLLLLFPSSVVCFGVVFFLILIDLQFVTSIF